VTRTLNLRIWNPLLCQLSYRRPYAHSKLPLRVALESRRGSLLPLNLVKCVLAKSRAIFFIALLYLFVNAALHADARSIIKITRLRALEPYVFTIFCLGHCSTSYRLPMERTFVLSIACETFNYIQLLNNLRYNTGTNCTTAFANRKSESCFHRNWLVFKVNCHLDVVTRHAHFSTT
jgi:hypothetical protein